MGLPDPSKDHVAGLRHLPLDGKLAAIQNFSSNAVQMMAASFAAITAAFQDQQAHQTHHEERMQQRMAKLESALASSSSQKVVALEERMSLADADRTTLQTQLQQARAEIETCVKKKEFLPWQHSTNQRIDALENFAKQYGDSESSRESLLQLQKRSQAMLRDFEQQAKSVSDMRSDVRDIHSKLAEIGALAERVGAVELKSTENAARITDNYTACQDRMDNLERRLNNRMAACEKRGLDTCGEVRTELAALRDDLSKQMAGQRRRQDNLEKNRVERSDFDTEIGKLTQTTADMQAGEAKHAQQVASMQQSLQESEAVNTKKMDSLVSKIRTVLDDLGNKATREDLYQVNQLLNTLPQQQTNELRQMRQYIETEMTNAEGRIKDEHFEQTNQLRGELHELAGELEQELQEMSGGVGLVSGAAGIDSGRAGHECLSCGTHLEAERTIYHWGPGRSVKGGGFVMTPVTGPIIDQPAHTNDYTMLHDPVHPSRSRLIRRPLSPSGMSSDRDSPARPRSAIGFRHNKRPDTAGPITNRRPKSPNGLANRSSSARRRPQSARSSRNIRASPSHSQMRRPMSPSTQSDVMPHDLQSAFRSPITKGRAPKLAQVPSVAPEEDEQQSG